MPEANPPSVTPLEGTTTVDDQMFFEPECLSYRGAADIAKEIASRCAALVTGKRVVIAGSDLLADMANLQSCCMVLDDLKRNYEGLASHAGPTSKRIATGTLSPDFTAAVAAAAAPPVAAAATMVNAALGLASMFRQNVTFSGRKTSVDELAFALALASEVKACGAREVFLPQLLAFHPHRGPGSLQDRLAATQTARAAVWTFAGPLVSHLVILEGQLDQAVRDKDQKLVDTLTAEVSALRRDLDPLTAPLDRADRRLIDLENQWSNIDPATGITGLGRLLRAEALQALDGDYLHAHIVSSGGYYKTTRSLLRTIFSGDGFSFMGGVTARWALLKSDGTVTLGGILTRRYRGYHPARLKLLEGLQN